MRRTVFVALLTVFLALTFFGGLSAFQKPQVEEEEQKEKLDSAVLTALKFRLIGPALTSGRVGDVAVHPSDPRTYFVAAASGGVWKTENWGTTWKPVFDQQKSYSIGCVSIDRSDPLTVWVGTGENNSQRSVSYGDGVYKSIDGGRTWKNVGLESSEHIGKIVIDPRDSRRVFVAAQGPLWSAGGNRGLYLTEDGGETWEKVLEISENTGVTDLVYDPGNPDLMLAAAYQRRRRVWTLIDGGPESAIYKSTDGGRQWRKITAGLPSGDLGRIGLAISPVNPEIAYAIVEASGDLGGFFRSDDRGESWQKQSSYLSSSPQYYQEIVADPVDVNRVYSLDTYLMVTTDGGKNFSRAGESSKHVDNHALWINPENPRHLLAGSDGGVYESFDQAATWDFKANLPLTQFYRISADNATPFYNVYGGTQDNFSLGGPSQTTTVNGIVNSDWYVTAGGDGFETQIDPTDPNIIYSQSQYGNLQRFDKRSGERVNIQPQPDKNQPPLRWNWDSPLLISPHSPTRLYFAANRLFRSDDRGQSWQVISPDLTRNMDRNQLEVMGQIWNVDAVAKSRSTSFYGNIVALAESPLREGLLFVGTDDGLIQVSENSGQSWHRIEAIPGIPEMSYVSRLEASQHDADTVYAAFDNHKSGDFKPYLMKSTDRGQNWQSLSSDLPERGSVYGLVEDHVKPELLFVGTEFGVFVTLDGGQKWIQMKAGLPTIAVRDLEIQERENDLVVGTFGRGIYILDDYSPLREISEQVLDESFFLFPVKTALLYIQSSPLGGREKAFQGDSFYTASNPPFGAIFTYYLKDPLQTRKERRQSEEKQAIQDDRAIALPDWDDLRREAREEKPFVVATISDAEGNVIRRITGPTSAGTHRISWDLRYPALVPSSDSGRRFRTASPLVVPGTYQVTFSSFHDGEFTDLGEARHFQIKALDHATLPARDRVALLDFQKQVSRLQSAVMGAVRVTNEIAERLELIKNAIRQTPDAPRGLFQEALVLEHRLDDIQIALTGDSLRRSYSEPTPPSIVSRVQQTVFGHSRSTSDPTETQRQDYRIATDEFRDLLTRLRGLVERDLKQLEARLDEVGAPWTPGRLPEWPDGR